MSTYSRIDLDREALDALKRYGRLPGERIQLRTMTWALSITGMGVSLYAAAVARHRDGTEREISASVAL